jgi:hypothetical protein
MVLPKRWSRSRDGGAFLTSVALISDIRGISDGGDYIGEDGGRSQKTSSSRVSPCKRINILNLAADADRTSQARSRHFGRVEKFLPISNSGRTWEVCQFFVPDSFPRRSSMKGRWVNESFLCRFKGGASFVLQRVALSIFIQRGFGGVQDS